MIIIIDNLNYHYHYEIIESIICKYNEIIKININSSHKLYLNNIIDKIYINYIKKKYSNIIINQNIDKFNYKIYTTISQKDLINFKNNLLKQKNIFFICHEVNEKYLNYPNIFYLTPLCNNKNYISCDILPSITSIKHKQSIPIYIIQGNIEEHRRNYNLLLNILKNEYKYLYKIKIIGRGEIPESFNKYKKNIIFCKNYNFIDFHEAFHDCYCILPLITKNKNPQYYKNKLTSSINYAKSYNLYSIIDKELQDIYNLKNTFIYNDENNIHDIFNKSLEHFYKKIL
jgi:hypothetical protein